MITNFKYISPIAEAYEGMLNESFPQDVKELLDTKYKPVYKSDGYDQFGVDVSGRDRRGRPVAWRYPDRWFGDASKLEAMLKYAKKKEEVRNGSNRRIYDRYGFNTIGYDRQGFDINDKDILGHDGSEYGTEEYDALGNERDRAHHNVLNKLSMRRQVHAKRDSSNVTPEKEKHIVDAYRNAAKSQNPTEEFRRSLNRMFVKVSKKGNLLIDHAAVNHYLRKYPFDSNKPTLDMPKEEFAAMFESKFIEQLGRVLRPYAPEDYFTVSTEIKPSTDRTGGIESVIRATLKPEILSNKSINPASILKMAEIASNRMELILPYSGYSHWSDMNGNSITVHAIVNSDVQNDISNRRRAVRLADEFEEKHGLKSYFSDEKPKNPIG